MDKELGIGHVQWHSSEEDGPPDVGVLLRLDENDSLWCGEITREFAEEWDIEELGWWLVWEQGGKRKPIAHVNPESDADYLARDFIDVLAVIIRKGLPHKVPAHER